MSYEAQSCKKLIDETAVVGESGVIADPGALRAAERNARAWILAVVITGLMSTVSFGGPKSTGDSAVSGQKDRSGVIANQPAERLGHTPNSSGEPAVDDAVRPQSAAEVLNDANTATDPVQSAGRDKQMGDHSDSFGGHNPFSEAEPQVLDGPDDGTAANKSGNEAAESGSAWIAAGTPGGDSPKEPYSRATGRFASRRPGARLAEPSTSASGDSIPWYRTGLGALATVLALIALAAWAVRRWVPAARSGESPALCVLARVPVTPRHSVALLRVGRRMVLVGIGNDGMVSLGEMRDADEVAELLMLTGDPHQPGKQEFEKQLTQHLQDYDRVDGGEEKPMPNGGSAAVRGRAAVAAPNGRPAVRRLLERLRTLQGADGESLTIGENKVR